MKRIKIITHENFPYGGAPANLLRYISLALSAEALSVEVILPTGNVYGNNVESKPEKKGLVKNVKYKHLGFTKHPHNYIGKLLDILIGLFYTPLYLLSSNIRSKYDIIISYNPHVSRIFMLILFKKIFKKKLIVILSEFYEKPSSGLLSLYHWYDFYFGMKYLTKYADAYIPASHYLKNYLEKELNIKKPIFVLPNLMDPEMFHVEQSEAFISCNITIGYTGTPTRKDGVVDLINSFAILNKKYPNTHLLIIGDVINGNSVIPPLKELAVKLRCDHNITFTGLIPFQKIPTLLNSCQILTLTRPNGVFAEAGFPTKLGEYFACKKPVLITRVGDIDKYFINEKHAIIVEPENIENIVAGFEKIINNNYLSQLISKNAHDWMNENLNYKNVSPKLLAFLKNI